MFETSDGGYVLAGTIVSPENGDLSWWMAKIIPQKAPTTTTSPVLTTTGTLIPPMLSEIPNFINYVAFWALLSLIWFRKKQHRK